MCARRIVLDKDDDSSISGFIYEALRRNCPEWDELREDSQQWNHILEENPQLQDAAKKLTSVPRLESVLRCV